eukprot:3750487-Rhodomonas_salina.1
MLEIPTLGDCHSQWFRNYPLLIRYLSFFIQPRFEIVRRISEASMLARFASGARVFSRRAVTPVVARRAASPVVFRKQWMSTSKEDLLLVEEEVTIAMEDVDFVENLKRLPAGVQTPARAECGDRY